MIVNRTVSMNIPIKPINRRVLRPAASTNTDDITVIATFIAPIAIVPIWAFSTAICDDLKISVE